MGFDMSRAIVVANAGSSSLKFTEYLVRADRTLQRHLGGTLEELYGAARFRARDAEGNTLAEHRWPVRTPPGHEGALDFIFQWMREAGSDADVIAVGHRVVHGGADYAAPVRIDDTVLTKLEALVPLAPLHQPHNLLPIRLIARHRPELPQFACFDTAFHHGMPAVAQAFALPPSITEQGVRRYGFHGLSYEYIASVLPRYDAAAAAGRTIVLHLGNGASMCALLGGRSIASTMGFTALDGLPMGTRSGNLDPGVLLYLQNQRGMDAATIEDLLYRGSGLLGVSGISSDMRELLNSSDPRAAQAVDLFVYRISRELGSLAAALGGLDAIVFTAGIGEHAARVRAAVCSQARWLGLELDPTANGGNGPRISMPDSAVSAWIIRTDEELMIGQHCLAGLG